MNTKQIKQIGFLKKFSLLKPFKWTYARIHVPQVNVPMSSRSI